MIFAEELPPEEREKLLQELERLQVPKTSYVAVKLKKEYRARNGLCTACGKPNKDTIFKLCAKCREIWKKDAAYSQAKKNSESKSAPKKKPGRVLSIAEVTRMAMERHISYGQMVVLIEKEGIYK